MEIFLKGNEKLVHRLTHQLLNKSDIQSPEHIYMNDAFDKNICKRIGPDSTPDNFPDINIEGTPNYDFYEDDSDNGMLEGPDEEK